jgi:hypothetical protein
VQNQRSALNDDFHSFIERLRGIDVPRDVRTDYVEMTSRYERALKSQEALVLALEAGDSAAAEREDAAVTNWGDRGDEIALRLSLTECALDPGEDVPFENSP